MTGAKHSIFVGGKGQKNSLSTTPLISSNVGEMPTGSLGEMEMYSH